ncbi:MAG: DUF285 domain-containing protein [Bacteroidales bacterium]|nr:DUF285 domain-containing protein [Bacteroidales bacterium]
MKKTSLAFAAFAALALSFSSCQKESATLTFSAHTEAGSSKTTLNNVTHYFEWESGDQVEIFASTHATFTATPNTANPILATLNGENIGDAPYTAIYPASIAVSSTGVELPKEQVSTDGSLRNFPMYATSNNTQLLFTNLCAAICIKLPEGSAKLSRIDVVADQPISGRCNISTTATTYSNNKPYAVATTDGYKYVSLTISDPTSNTNNEYCVTMPAGVYHNFEIRMYDGSGNICHKSVSDADGLTLVRNTLNTIQFTNVSFAAPRIAKLKYHAFSGFGSAKEIVFHYNSNVTSSVQIQNTGSEVIYAEMNGDVCDVYTPADYIYAPENASELFSLATENSRPLEHIDFGYYFRTNETTNMNCMFYAAENLVSLDLSTFNTVNVSDMGKMFEGCQNLTKLDLTSFNSNSLTLMYNMFYWCTHLSSIEFNSAFNAPVPDWGEDATEDNRPFLAKNLKRACDVLGVEAARGCTIYCNTTTEDRLTATHTQAGNTAAWVCMYVHFNTTY